MPSKAFIPILVGMMLLTGVCNTLLTKYQDMQCVRNCDSPDPSARQTFEQPVWQTAQMFVGEMGCWLVVVGSMLHQRLRKQNPSSNEDYSSTSEQSHDEIRRDSIGDEADDEDEDEDGAVDPLRKPLLPGNPLAPQEPPRLPLTGWRILLLALPAWCDIAGTTLMNVGLLFVAASIYQMVRGALVLFVGLFSFTFLGRRLSVAKWSALVIVVLGVAVVGLAGIVEGGRNQDRKLPGHDDPDAAPPVETLLRTATLYARSLVFHPQTSAPEAQDAALRTAIGILLIFGAQLFTASQFVLEEAIMHRYSMSALSVVGWEGTFGLSTTLLLMLILHIVVGRTPAGRGGYFDVSQGWADIVGNPAIGVSSLLIMLSIGGFNFFGLSVTRTVSATSRSTIDTCRTLFIWVVSLGLRWERFKWLQVVGFAALVYGTFLFNGLVGPPGLGWWRRMRGERRESELLRERPIEHS